MNKIFVHFLILVLMGWSLPLCCEPITSLLPRKDPLQLKVGVIIPCHGKHIAHLPQLLQLLAEQTVPPDEVVIGLTKGQSPPDLCFSQQKLPFVVRIAWTNRNFPGYARNVACEACEADLLICQDADDLPHPKRIEIIRWLFQNYWIDILIHRWSPSSVTAWESYSLEESVARAHPIERYHQIDRQFDFIHNGSPALLKQVAKRIQWTSAPTREDLLFNAEAFRLFQHHIVLDEYLVIYRFELSSYRDRFKRSM